CRCVGVCVGVSVCWCVCVCVCVCVTLRRFFPDIPLTYHLAGALWDAQNQMRCGIPYVKFTVFHGTVFFSPSLSASLSLSLSFLSFPLSFFFLSLSLSFFSGSSSIPCMP